MQPSNAEYSVPPFPPFPCASRYVALGSIADSLDRIARGIAGREGISLVIGPPGTGKSLVCSILGQMFSASHKVVVLGDMPMSTAEDFYRCFLHAIGADYTSIADNQLQFAVADEVTSDELPEQGVLLVIDEGQSLSAEVLESVRLTTNIKNAGEPCVSSVICGNAKLEESLVVPAMEEFTQRVATRCYLHPLNAEESRYYISESIRVCGGIPGETISDEAMAAVHHACGGIPRLINQMMTQAIDCAADSTDNFIDEAVIDRAWAKLQQLPSPVMDEPKITHNVAPVEFGTLEALEEPSVRQEEAAPLDETMLDEQVAIEGPASVDVPSVPDSDEEQGEVAELIASPEAQLEEDLAAATSFSEISTPQYGEIDEAAYESALAELPEPPKIDLQSVIDEELSLELELTEATYEPPVSDAPDGTEYVPAAPDTGFGSMLAASSPLPSSLFGEFAEEEELDVCDVAQPTVEFTDTTPTAELPVVETKEPEPATLKMAPAVQDDLPPESELDFEESVHQDVLKLNEMAAQARYGAIDPTNTFGEPLRLPTAETEPAPAWDEEPTQPATTDSLDEPTATQPAEPATDGIAFRDDSDLLIIEEEVDVVPRPMGLERKPTEERAMTVDFQAMLAKMRNS